MQINLSDIQAGLIIGCSVVFLIIAGLVFFVVLQRKQRNIFLQEKELTAASYTQAILRAQTEIREETLTALAKELHDNVGQLLSSSKMLLSMSEKQLLTIPHTFKVAQESVAKAITELRTISKSLDADWIKTFSIDQQLQEEANRLSSGNSLQIELAVKTPVRLSPGKQLILFRIMQEALQNVVKHAGASVVTVGLFNRTENIIATIADNGEGDFNLQTTGQGIANMRQRAASISARIDFEKQAKGNAVIITIPVEPNE